MRWVIYLAIIALCGFSAVLIAPDSTLPEWLVIIAIAFIFLAAGRWKDIFRTFNDAFDSFREGNEKNWNRRCRRYENKLTTAEE